MKFNRIKPLIYLCSLMGLSTSYSAIATEPSSFASKPNLVNVGTSAKNSKMAKTELRTLLNQFVNLQASFNQQIVDAQGTPLQATTGKVILSKPQMLRWETLQPDPSQLIADGSTVYNVDPFVEQVTLIDQASLTQSNPLMLLVSDDDAQWDAVEIEKQDDEFVVRSLDPNALINVVILSFDQAGRISLLSSVDRQQQRNVIEFSDVTVNAILPSDTFSFVAPNNWVIDDQRSTN
ncbi:MAG: outer membrane lipoprotein chaperone LolA [Glaciecola sp.]